MRNVAVRRNYVKQHSKAKSMCIKVDIKIMPNMFAGVLFAILPEYSLPYAIYFIAHHPDFQRLNFQSLDVFRE